MPKGVNQGALPDVISPKPVSREFACEWQFNGLPTIRPSLKSIGWAFFVQVDHS
jgi:hypothetical protein